MNTTLRDDLARLIGQEPARSLDAVSLHRRACRELGLDLTMSQLLQALEAEPDRFRVLPPTALPDHGWCETDRLRYREALQEAGIGCPVVTVSERRPDDTAYCVPDDVFGCTHDALTELLRAAPGDESLGGAVTAALAELRSLRQALSAEDGYGPTRRSSTLHHCSSTSSASTVKPAASAASRMSGASSTRMPERMAHPPAARAR